VAYVSTLWSTGVGCGSSTRASRKRRTSSTASGARATLAEAFAKFLALKSNKKTAREFQRVAEHLKAAFGADTVLTGITAARIAEYKAERLAVRRSGKPLTAAAVNRPLGLLRTLLRQAHRWK
jgi:hypothetical protein